MRHPFRCGALLAIVLASGVAALGTPAFERIFHGTDKDLLLLGAGVIVGAFAASVPGRVRRRRQPGAPLRWKPCVLAFVCGLAMMIAARLSGLSDAAMAVGAMQGGLGALVFAGAAWTAAFLAARWRGGRTS